MPRLLLPLSSNSFLARPSSGESESRGESPLLEDSFSSVGVTFVDDVSKSKCVELRLLLEGVTERDMTIDNRSNAKRFSTFKRVEWIDIENRDTSPKFQHSGQSFFYSCDSHKIIMYQLTTWMRRARLLGQHRNNRLAR